MKKRPHLTIVLVTAARLARADFMGLSAGLSQLWKSERKPGTTASEAVRSALALGGTPSSQVWVLCEDLFCQSVTLPEAQTARLSPKELADALGFEVEPFSNLSPGSSAIGCRAVTAGNGTRLHWVVECSQGEWATIREVVAKAGGRLAGMSHPGGLPVPVGDLDPARAWHRVEQWAHGLVLVRALGGSTHGVSVQSLSTVHLADSSVSALEPSETLSETGAIPRTHATGRRLALSAEGDLRSWLEAWGRCLGNPSDELALIVPEPSATWLNRYVTVGAVAEAVVVAVCLAYGLVASCHRDRLRERVDELRQEVAQIEQAERANADVRREIADLKQAARDRKEAADLLARQRRAIPFLLRSLASVRPSDVVIQELRDEGDGGMRINGIGMTPGAIDELGSRLSEALREVDWMVQPVEKVAQGILDNAGPWRFGLRVAPAAAWATDRLPASEPDGGME